MTKTFEEILERLRLSDEDRAWIVEKLADPEHMASLPKLVLAEDPFPDPFGMGWAWADPEDIDPASSPIEASDHSEGQSPENNIISA